MDSKEKERGKDIMWYIWLSENSPLFGKDKMATFERYFLAEKETHKEKKNPYYLLLEDEKVICHILKEFGLENKDAHIINGHVPVKCKDGGKTDQVRRKSSGDRWWIFESVSERNRYCRIYIDLQFLWTDPGCA